MSRTYLAQYIHNLLFLKQFQHSDRQFIVMTRQLPEIHSFWARFQRCQHPRRYGSRQIERTQWLRRGTETLDREQGTEPQGKGDAGAGFDLRAKR